MPMSFNGTGSMWYGKADEHPDGSYVVTEWLTCVYFPIIPRGSKRVWPIEGGKFNIEPVPMHMPHIFKAYGLLFGLFILIKLAG